MRLPRILRTTSFRLTLLYVVLFLASVVLLFGVMFWLGNRYFTDQIDESVTKEIIELQTAASGQDGDTLRNAVASYAKDAPPGVYYLLQDGGGRPLAGNMPPMAPVGGVRSWPGQSGGDALPVEAGSVRGRGVLLEDGAYLFVGLDANSLDRIRAVVLKTFLWGLGVTLLLAIVGGVVMSLGLLRRVEDISRASDGIVGGGDLSKRIELLGTNDEFDHLARSLNLMLERIQSLMEGLRQVSNEIAHDLRTPLSRLRQRLEYARRHANSVEELHQTFDRSIQDVDDILDTFSALLRIAQIEAHTNASGLAPLDLAELLTGILETYEPIAEERGQRLTGDIAGDMTITGDRELLPQLFTNLTENAIWHCPLGAHIAIEARRGPHGIEVAIADNGPGIPAHLRDKVFERFVRLDAIRAKEGTGLGLTLAAAIARLHDTRIELSDNHPGLRARVVFPAAS